MRVRMTLTRAAMIAAACFWPFDAVFTAQAAKAAAGGKSPNILVIFGDDIGTWNVGVYTHGMMGRTPNIDRIAREGVLFTDHWIRVREDR